MKVLIIGGAGFVGKHLIGEIRDKEKWQLSVTKLDIESINEAGISIYDMDILKPDEVLGILNEVKPDVIYHLAAQSSVALSWKNPGLTVDINVKGSLNVLDAVKKLDYRPRVILIGSGEEYGHIKPEETPVSEGNVLRPGNIYAATKAVQNMIGKIYADAYNMDIVMVRAFNHIGPGQMPIFVVADFCKQVAEIKKRVREPIIKVGNLSAKRDFTDVRDVVRAYALLATKGVSGQTYNVGSGKALEIREILDKIIDISGMNITVEVEKERLRPVDVPIIEADVSKLFKDTGWNAEINLEKTIKETIDYWCEKI